MKRRKKIQQQNRWTRNSAKEEYWRQQLALWQKSGLSIRAFCKEHGIVEGSFYGWRRELIIRAREDGSAEEIARAETPNTLKDGRGRTVAIRYRQTDQSTLEALMKKHAKSNPFVPIQIVHPNVNPEKSSECQRSGGGRTGIEIVLPGGAVIRLGDECNIRLVAELLSVLNG